MRDINSVLTDRNLRIVGLIERNQSIRLEGTLRAASKKQLKCKTPRVVITEGGDEERTPTDNELAAGSSAGFQATKGRRKGKAAAYKRPKSSWWKSVVVSLPVPGIRISEAPSSPTESPFEGLADISIPDYVSFQHDTGLEELSSALDLS